MKNKFRDPILWAICLMIWSISWCGVFIDAGNTGKALSSGIMAIICLVYILAEAESNGLYKS